jgi:hypothetical protein
VANIADLVVNLRADIAQFRSSFEQAAQTTQHFERQTSHSLEGVNKSLELTSKFTQGLTDKLRGLVSAFGAGFAVRELFVYTRQALTTTAAIYDQAKALGITTTRLQEYQFAAKQAGVAMPELSIGLEALSRNVGVATEPGPTGKVSGRNRGALILRDLGIPLKDLQGQLLPMGQIFESIVSKLGTMKDQTRALADAVQLFGQNAGGQILALAREDLPALIREAQATGQVVDASTVAAGKRMNDELQKISGTLRTQFTTSLVALGPVLVKWAGDLKIAAEALASYETADQRAFDLAKAQQRQRVADELVALTKEREALLRGGPGALLKYQVPLGQLSQALVNLNEQIKEGKARLAELMKSAAPDDLARAAPAAVAAAALKSPAETAAAKARQQIEDRIQKLQLQANEQHALFLTERQGAAAVHDLNVELKANNEIIAAGLPLNGKLAEELRAAARDYDTTTQAVKRQQEATANLQKGQERYDAELAKTLALTDGLSAAQRAAADKIGLLEQAYMAGKITLPQLNSQRQTITAQAFKSGGAAGDMRNEILIGNELAHTANHIAKSFIDAGMAAGKGANAMQAFGSAAASIASDLEQLILKLVIINPLMNSIGSALSPGYKAAPTLDLSGLGSGIWSWLGFGAGSSAAASSAASGSSAALSDLFSETMLGFARGGSFDVGGAGGADSRLVAFKASPGEHVQVGPPDQFGRGGGGVGNVHIYNNTPSQVSAHHETNSSGGRDLIVQVDQALAYGVRSGQSDLFRAIRDSAGVQRTPVQR